jgi:integrase
MATIYSTSQIPTARRESRFAPWQQVGNGSITPDMLFEDAADKWLKNIAPIEGIAGRPGAHRIRANTNRSYGQYLNCLKLFFGGMKLAEIRLDHIRLYEDARVVGSGPFVRKRRPNQKEEAMPCPASAKKVNQEISMLKRILRTAKLWGDEERQLHTSLAVEEAEIPRALSADEQRHWLRVAASEERWHFIYWYSVLAFSTCMSTNEIRALRLGDIDLEQGIIKIPWAGSKNIYRHRTVSIGNSEAGDETIQAVLWFMERAEQLGSREPTNFLFPFRKMPFPYDPKRPMSSSGIRKPWDEVRIASGLKWFRQYDTRHTAITRFAELPGVTIATIMKMAGHISPRMTDHYTHICERHALDAQRRARRQLWGGSEPEATRSEAIERPAPMIQREANSAPTNPSPVQTPRHVAQPPRISTPSLPADSPQSTGGISGTFSRSSYFFLPQVSRPA